MNIFLKLGGVRFRFDFDCDIIVEDTIVPFFCSAENVIDINIHVLHDFTLAPLPRGPMVGEDLLMEYYRQDQRLICLTKGGQGRFLSCCSWAEGSAELTCWLNFSSGSPADTLGNILRMIPLLRLLLQSGVLFFHASQVALDDIGILFSAPSGTGKTTQAKLWSRYRGAQILCNDRTLTDLRHTYGYPVDGSEPISSNQIRDLGAIVLLEQAPVNTVVRLSPRRALTMLMPQLVLDAWDPGARSAAAELLLELIARTPVYLLKCTPDEQAVQCLSQQLWKDRVITNA